MPFMCNRLSVTVLQLCRRNRSSILRLLGLNLQNTEVGGLRSPFDAHMLKSFQLQGLRRLTRLAFMAVEMGILKPRVTGVFNNKKLT